MVTVIVISSLIVDDPRFSPIRDFSSCYKKCSEMHGEFPIPKNFDDVHALGEVMKRTTSADFFFNSWTPTH